VSRFFHRNRPGQGDRGKVNRAPEATANRSDHLSDWRDYDAEAFERVAVRLTGAAARDLVELAEPPLGARVLDVGTGTGIAAEAAASMLGEGGVVIGADLSLDMLTVGARSRPGLRLVAADAVDLPFGSETFDAVTANFMIALVPKYDTVLFDMIRVVRTGGRIALTWWGKGEDEFMRAWRELCIEAVGQEMIDDANAQFAPWSDRFGNKASFEETLRHAGLHPVRVETREYRIQMSRDDYLLHRSTSATGRFVRRMLGDDAWGPFMDRARATYAGRFPEQINDFRDVNLAVATKPSDGLRQQDVQGSVKR
jgi:ubiquinone/menaquinone biosynthesis C-methylase UbiE